jgi:hypothetical protein
VLRANQTITFGPLPGRTFVDPPFDVTATASSGLAVSFSSAGACSVSGSAVRITGGGKCTITASQPGNNNYNPATPVSQTFSIACFPPQRMPFGIPGGPGTAQMTQLGIKDQLPAEGVACTGSFLLQMVDGGLVTVGTGTLIASTTGSVVMGNLRGTLIPALGSVPFTAVLTLDVSSQQGNVRTTFADPRGPVTIQVYFSKVGDVYVLTRVIVS